MEEWIQSGFPKAPEVAEVVEGLVSLLKPKKVYLYNQRLSVAGDTTGFKLCIVADMENKDEVEKTIYREIDSDIPFDVILYTPAEWSRLRQNPDTFARKIHLTGMVIYG